MPVSRRSRSDDHQRSARALVWLQPSGSREIMRRLRKCDRLQLDNRARCLSTPLLANVATRRNGATSYVAEAILAGAAHDDFGARTHAGHGDQHRAAVTGGGTSREG